MNLQCFLLYCGSLIMDEYISRAKQLLELVVVVDYLYLLLPDLIYLTLLCHQRELLN